MVDKERLKSMFQGIRHDREGGGTEKAGGGGGGQRTHLVSAVVLHLPAARQLERGVGEAVDEGDEVAVVLVALEDLRIAPDLVDHVLEVRVAVEVGQGALKHGAVRRCHRQ